jgi:GNAT superfamily N-acetyltransferase
MPLQLRTLAAGEEERLLDLLDGWPFGDDTRGSVFFRRYLEQDPSYHPDNLWVAADGPQPVACVQIFPRRMRVRAGSGRPATGAGEAVAELCGGIGTVYTEASYRRQGLGGELLSLAANAMRTRGFGLSALLATRVEWYQSHGWQPWCSHQWRLRVIDAEWLDQSTEEREPSVVDSAAVDAALSQAMFELRSEFCRSRLGTVVHDAESWAASFALAGNPEEQIRVGRGASGAPSAYLRTTDLYGDLQFLEWARDEAGLELQLDLFREALRDSGRASALLSAVEDSPLFEALRQRGLVAEQEPQATWLLRSFERRAGSLEQRLPRQRFEFFMSDRF